MARWRGGAAIASQPTGDGYSQVATLNRIHGQAHCVTRRAVGGGAAALLAGALFGCGGSAAAPFDRQFIDMMVPHHEGAVEMAKIAQQRAQRPEIKQMADALAWPRAAGGSAGRRPARPPR